MPALASMATSFTNPHSTMFMPKSGSMMASSALSTWSMGGQGQAELLLAGCGRLTAARQTRME